MPPGSELNLVSLFGGISGIEQAFRQMGLDPRTWMYEVNPQALAISQKNFPNTQQMGSVEGVNWNRAAREMGPVDLLCGGFPCQDLSNMNQKGLGLQGSRSGLFYTMLDAMQALQPKNFIAENVVPRDARRQDHINEISRLLGVEPYRLQAADYGPVMRDRYIWSNLPLSPKPDNAPTALEMLAGRPAGPEVPQHALERFLNNLNPNAQKKHSIPILEEGGRNKFKTLLSSANLQDVYNNAYQIGRGGPIQYVHPDTWYEAFGFPRDYWKAEGITPSQALARLGNSFSIPMILQVLKNMPYQGGTVGDWQQRQSGLVVPPERPRIEINTPQKFLSTGSYYNTPGLRDIAHGIKSGDPDAIRQAAQLMAPRVPENSVLVPIPSRSGVATETLRLAQEIAKILGVPVADALRGAERESQYEAKKQGRLVSPDTMNLRLEGSLPEGRTPLLIDNVIATGTTANAASNALNNARVLALASDDSARKNMEVTGAMPPKEVPTPEIHNPYNLPIKIAQKIAGDPLWFLTSKQKSELKAAEKRQGALDSAQDAGLMFDEEAMEKTKAPKVNLFTAGNYPIPGEEAQKIFSSQYVTPQQKRHWELATEAVQKFIAAQTPPPSSSSPNEQMKIFSSLLGIAPGTIDYWNDANKTISEKIRGAIGQTPEAIREEARRSSSLPVALGVQHLGERIKEKGFTDDAIMGALQDTAKTAPLAWLIGKTPFAAPAAMGGDLAERYLPEAIPPEWRYAMGAFGGGLAEAASILAKSSALPEALTYKMAADVAEPWVQLAVLRDIANREREDAGRSYAPTYDMGRPSNPFVEYPQGDHQISHPLMKAIDYKPPEPEDKGNLFTNYLYQKYEAPKYGGYI